MMAGSYQFIGVNKLHLQNSNRSLISCAGGVQRVGRVSIRCVQASSARVTIKEGEMTPRLMISLTDAFVLQLLGSDFRSISGRVKKKPYSRVLNSKRCTQQP